MGGGLNLTKAMPEQEPDQIDQHVARVQQGDRNAYRFVVDQLIANVRAYVVSHSLPGVDVDDVVQRSFVEAYASISDYKLGTSFVAWVVTIARYQLLRETSRLRRAADYHRKYVPVALANQSEQQLHAADEQESRLKFLKECLEKLPEHGRQVLRARYERADPISEIADSMNRSAGAVRKQLCLLRKQLHECVTRRLAQVEVP